MARPKKRAKRAHRSSARRAKRNPKSAKSRRHRAAAKLGWKRRLRSNPRPKAKLSARARAELRGPERKAHQRKTVAERRSLVKRLASSAKRLRARAKSAPARSVKRSTLNTQAKRASLLHRIAAKGGPVKRSPVYQHMHVKTNPGIAGLVAGAKVLLPQVAAGGAAMVLSALLGKKLADLITTTADPVAVATAAAAAPATLTTTSSTAAGTPTVATPSGTAGLGAVRDAFTTTNAAGVKVPTMLATYMPAISTAGVSLLGYWLANKFAPKYKGAVIIGGMMSAVLQGILAAAGTNATGFAATAKRALVGGVGDYTMIGGRSYAESGIFRDVGDYTEVGDAYSTARPRNSQDNRSQFAATGSIGDAYSTARPRNTLDNRSEMALNGMDDATEFSPGEGGVFSRGSTGVKALAGGIFRGPPTR